MAKRLFPGCDGKGRGVARFTANRRNTGDLNWLMLRYPLRIRETDALRWQEALEGAREFARARGAHGRRRRASIRRRHSSRVR